MHPNQFRIAIPVCVDISEKMMAAKEPNKGQLQGSAPNDYASDDEDDNVVDVLGDLPLVCVCVR